MAQTGAVPTPITLRLLRHGQTQANVDGALDTGFPGLPLTELGRAQADAAAGVLGSEPIGSVFVSRLIRTHQTASPVARSLGVTPTEHAGLVEISAGEFEMANDEKAIEAYIGTLMQWFGGDLDARLAGGESGREFLGRYDSAINEAVDQTIAEGNDSLLVVSHGAAIRTWAGYRLAGRADTSREGRLENTACVTLTGHPSTGWELVDWHSEPIGGALLRDPSADDPTGHVAE